MVKILGPVIWMGSIPLSFPNWAQPFFQLGLPPYSMPGWPTWLSNSWAGTNSLINGFRAWLVLHLMRVMTEISPLITSFICLPNSLPFTGDLVFPHGYVYFLWLGYLVLLAKNRQLLLGLNCFQKKDRLCFQYFHLKNTSFLPWMLRYLLFKHSFVQLFIQWMNISEVGG